MSKIKLPSIVDVAYELRLINTNVDIGEDPDESCEVRLQVYENGNWVVHYGDPQYDTDHHGFWGASSVPGYFSGHTRRFNSMDVARDLLSQVRDDIEQSK